MRKAVNLSNSSRCFNKIYGVGAELSALLCKTPTLSGVYNSRVSGSLAFGSFDPSLRRYAPQTSDTRQPLDEYFIIGGNLC